MKTSIIGLSFSMLMTIANAVGIVLSNWYWAIPTAVWVVATVMWIRVLVLEIIDD